ncbi:condensation domain-containing protein [Methanobacterium formicicum]|uniref:Condensation domain-containing protein n=1 Tax=Methanobacterium formicicum (strain DSM 3637 / PP1) TaxID=1204725 RepID=K2RV93_METFP|nr:condensation domain-containing protein [Methanobacterium formicicum]EKF86700.1 hypothetical protein A994_00400 [Methanobacterium formicicum DSM 3637]
MSVVKDDSNTAHNGAEHNVCNDDVSRHIRKVNNLERVYFWTPYSNVSLITRINGDISPEKLRLAINTACKMHPLLGAKIVFDEDNNAWFSSDNVPQPPFKIIQRVSNIQWFDKFQHEITIPFDLEKGPMIRFMLIHSEKVSELVIICNHCICDGMSLTYLVRDVLNYCVNPEKEIEMIPPQNMIDFFPKKGFSISSIMMRLFISQANRKWKKKPYTFEYEDSVALQNTYWDKNRFNTVLLELDPNQTRGLSNRCRENGVTVGSAVTTAFIAAREEINGPFKKNQKQIWIPFDLRRHAKEEIGDVFCLCVGAPSFSYTYNSKKPFWENVSILHEEIHKRVEKLDSEALEVLNFHPTLTDALSSFAPFAKVVPEAYTQTENLKQFLNDEKNIAFSFAKKAEHMVPGTIASNLGRLNIPEIYGDLKIDQMIFLPVMSNSVPLTMGGVSIGDKLVFSLIYPEPKNSAGSVTLEMIQIRNKALECLGFPDKISKIAF